MKKTQSFLHRKKRDMDWYKSYFAILVMVVLILTTASHGNITASIGMYDEEGSAGFKDIYSSESREDDFYISLNGGMGFSAVIYNKGTSDSTNVAVTLHVEGGFLQQIDKTITDTVNIPARGVAIISTGILLGLGPITITASANTTAKTERGIQILFFSKVLDETWNKPCQCFP